MLSWIRPEVREAVAEVAEVVEVAEVAEDCFMVMVITSPGWNRCD